MIWGRAFIYHHYLGLGRSPSVVKQETGVLGKRSIKEYYAALGLASYSKGFPWNKMRNDHKVWTDPTDLNG